MGKARIFKTKVFERFALKEGIADAALVEAVVKVEQGLIDADLGGGVIKQRVAREGQGESGGYRTLLAFRAEKRIVFLHGFAKSETDNIKKDELKALKKVEGDPGDEGRGSSEAGGPWKVRRGEASMKTAKRYKSPVLASVHETMEDLYEVGAIDKKTMREFDEDCLAPVEPLKPEAIKALRLRAKVSQAVFARHLNVTVGLVSQWERGEKRPSGPALKLLSLVKKHGLDAMI